MLSSSSSKSQADVGPRFGEDVDVTHLLRFEVAQDLSGPMRGGRSKVTPLMLGFSTNFGQNPILSVVNVGMLSVVIISLSVAPETVRTTVVNLCNCTTRFVSPT